MSKDSFTHAKALIVSLKKRIKDCRTAERQALKANNETERAKWAAQRDDLALELADALSRCERMDAAQQLHRDAKERLSAAKSYARAKASREPKRP